MLLIKKKLPFIKNIIQKQCYVMSFILLKYSNVEDMQKIYTHRLLYKTYHIIAAHINLIKYFPKAVDCKIYLEIHFSLCSCILCIYTHMLYLILSLKRISKTRPIVIRYTYAEYFIYLPI